MAKVIKDSEESKLRAKYKQAGKASVIVLENDHTLRIPSKSLWLNYLIGGGLCYGRVHEWFGYESTGKTLMALGFAAVAQELGGVMLFGDCERAFNYYWAEQNGIDLEKSEIYGGNDIEGFADWARDMAKFYRKKLTNNEPIILICDSIAALESITEIDGDMQNEKGSYKMGVAKKLNQFYRKRIDFFDRYGITVIMLNQVRPKIGATLYEAAETTPGGAATKFWASIRLMLKRSTAIKGRKLKDGTFKIDKETGRKVGQRIFVQVDKNKTAPPKGSIKTEVYFTDAKSGYVGYSKYHGFLECLVEMGIITKKGTKYYYKDEILVQGKDNAEDDFVALITEDKELRTRLIKKSGVNTISKTREKLASLKKNLYPVKTKKED